MSLSIYHTHTHSLGRISERGEVLSSEREREKNCWRSSFLSLGFTLAIGAHSISEEVVGFSPLWSPQGKYLSLLYLVIIVVVEIEPK